MTFTLRHLTLVGPNVPPASVDFSQHFTLIYGASDTGKSYVSHALDFMFGGSRLREIQEGSKYTRALLGIDLPSAPNCTLGRPLSGGTFALFRSDIRDFQSIPNSPDLMLDHAH